MLPCVKKTVSSLALFWDSLLYEDTVVEVEKF